MTKIHSGMFKKGQISYRKRVTLSNETKEKLRIAHLGKKLTLAHRKKLSDSHKGYKMPEEQKIKISEAHKGAKSHLWQGGITKEGNRIRTSRQYKLWRIAVYERDNYTCKVCLKKGGKLNADHIKQFAYYPELRFEVSNGQTLCEYCHKATPTYRKKRKVLQYATF